MCLQLADQSVRYPAGIAENIPVMIRDFFVLMDFVVLDMEVDKKIPLILEDHSLAPQMHTSTWEQEKFNSTLIWDPGEIQLQAKSRAMLDN
jgi:hypothetical protein